MVKAYSSPGMIGRWRPDPQARLHLRPRSASRIESPGRRKRRRGAWPARDRLGPWPCYACEDDPGVPFSAEKSVGEELSAVRVAGRDNLSPDHSVTSHTCKRIDIRSRNAPYLAESDAPAWSLGLACAW